MSGIIDCEIHIGDEVFIHGYIDEIRSDTIIIRNVGGYFGTSRDEVFYYEEDEYGSMNSADRKTEPLNQDLAKNEPTLVKDLVKAFGEDGTWLERQGVYTLTLAEAKQRAVDIIESVLSKTEPQTCANGCKWLDQDGECTEPSGVCHIEYRTEVDEPQTDCAWKKGE